MTQPLTQGMHHVGLSVADARKASRFFVDALGYEVVGGVADYPSVFVSDGSAVLTLWQTEEAATPFDRRRNIGLHHLALKVADDAALDAAFARVSAQPGVTIEFPPEPIGAGSATRHFIFAMPGGVRVELATPFS